MPLLRTVLGLDIGSHSIKAVELGRAFRGAPAAKLQAILRGEETPSELIRDLVTRRGLDTDSVVAAIPSDRVSVRRLQFPFSEKRRLTQAVPFEIEDQIPFDLEDVVIDWEVVSRERGRADVLAAVAPRSDISETIEMLAEGGADPRVLECGGLALANLRSAFDLPDPSILVDIGHRKTSFCALADGQAIASRAIRTAGLALTEALAEDRGLSPDAAETAKCEEGVIDPALGAPLPKVDRVLDRISSEILRLVSSLEPVLGGEEPQVVLMGGSAQLDQIDALIGARTGLPTERLGLPREESGTGLVAAGPPIVYAPAIALAMRGAVQASTAFNFRQDDLSRAIDFSRLRRDFGTTGVLAVIVALLSLASFGTSTYFESKRARGIEGQIAAIHQRALPGKPVPANALSSLRRAVQDAKDRANFLGVYRGNLSALDVLIEIHRLVPPELEVRFDELSIDRQTVRIRVFAESFEAAERLGAELSGYAPFANTRVGDITTEKRTGQKKFDLIISLTEDA